MYRQSRRLLLSLLLLASYGLAQESAPDLLLQVRPSTTVSHSSVYLKDVVEAVEGSIPAELENVDLCELADAEYQVVLDRRYLEMRLALLMTGQRVLLTGATECCVQRVLQAEFTESSLETHARKSLALQSGIPEDQLQVKVLQPVFSSAQRVADHALNLKFEFDFPKTSWLGRHQVQARAVAGDDLVWGNRVLMEISRRQSTLVLTTAINRDDVIQPAMLETRSMYLADSIAPVTLEQVVGMRAKRPLPAEAAITINDLVGNDPRGEDVVVQVRDAIRLEARSRGLKFVVPRAQAMQSGRVGQLIRVKNLHSNRIVTARVVGPGEAVVDLH